MLTNCCLSVRYELNQERAVPVMLKCVLRRDRRMEWLQENGVVDGVKGNGEVEHD